MKNLETRIEKLESQTEEVHRCYPVLLKLRGFNRRSVEDALGPNATIQEALAYLRDEEHNIVPKLKEGD